MAGVAASQLRELVVSTGVGQYNESQQHSVILVE